MNEAGIQFYFWHKLHQASISLKTEKKLVFMMQKNISSPLEIIVTKIDIIHEVNLLPKM